MGIIETMNNAITMKFDVVQDTPSEIQAQARELVLSGLCMVRDQMIADGKQRDDRELVLILDMLQELDPLQALQAELGPTVARLEAEIAAK